jgi:protein ImuB
MDQERVLVCSAEATLAGVELAMRRGGVSAIAPETILLERDGEKERRAIDAISLALLQYTPEVTHGEDFTILMDVSASLRAFNGCLALCRRVRANMHALGFTTRIGTAPTALGAWLLGHSAHAASTARQPIHARVVQMNSMARQLDRLPCALLPAANQHQEWLQAIGCENLGALRKLPRAGLQRRTNQTLLGALDRAYGLAHELFEWIVPPLTFSARIETHDRIEHADALMIGATGLILQMVGWLVSLQQAVSHFTIFLEHEHGRLAIPPTQIDISLAEPAWHEEHLLRLLKERLGRVELAAPVVAVRLEATQLEPMLPPNATLFPEPGGTPADFRRLLELLVARLGQENVLGLADTDDHRPEQANAWLPATVKRLPQPTGTECLDRPFWLLPKPVALLTRDDRPFYGSPLKLIFGPERIEAGWWDDAIAARDYFIAQGADASCYWIYLERTQHARWYLHGLYA